MVVSDVTQETNPKAERAAEGGETEAAPPRQTRQRSTISFPYGDLNDAMSIARAIHVNAGVSCDTDQLAAYMKQSVTSGAFRQNLSTARVFGLIETDRGTVRLTPLGREIMDPLQESAARATAFLTVPLYRAVFEQNRGHVLPPPGALQREMVRLGVAEKQGDKARQAFDRSAEQAGFFEQGRDRLVAPAGTADSGRDAEDDDPPMRGPQPTVEVDSTAHPTPKMHPFIQGLLDTLPNPGEDWASSDRQKWLQTAANIFDLIYDGEGAIEVRSALADRSPRPQHHTG